MAPDNLNYEKLPIPSSDLFVAFRASIASYHTEKEGGKLQSASATGSRESGTPHKSPSALFVRSAERPGHEASCEGRPRNGAHAEVLERREHLALLLAVNEIVMVLH